MVRNRKRVLVFGGAALVSLLLTGGCGNTKTAELELMGPGPSAVADASLGAGDSLGSQVFAVPAEGGTSFALLREIEQAVQVAEAKLEQGQYDQWFASFDRVESDTAIAAGESDDDGDGGAPTDVMVGVEVSPDGE